MTDTDGKDSKHRSGARRGDRPLGSGGARPEEAAAHSSMIPKNAFYAQSGAVIAVINASAGGVPETARQRSAEIGKIYAGRNGIIGALTEELIDTSFETEAAISGLKHTPGCRIRVLSPCEGFPTTAPVPAPLSRWAVVRNPSQIGLTHEHRAYEPLLDVCRAHDIGFFFSTRVAAIFKMRPTKSASWALVNLSRWAGGLNIEVPFLVKNNRGFLPSPDGGEHASFRA